MVKKIIMCVFLALLASGVLLQSAYLQNIEGLLLGITGEIETSLNNDNSRQTNELFTQLETVIEQHRPVLASVIHHEELDRLGLEIATLGAAVSLGDRYDISSALERVNFNITQIAGTDRTGIENVF